MTGWTADIVKHRYIEAAQTEWRLPLSGIGGGSTWPQYLHSADDRAGWSPKRLAEEQEARQRRAPPSAAAISRYEEVLCWTADRLHVDDHRSLVWAFAEAIASGRSFSEWCRRAGMVRVTAYRRLHRAFAQISASLCNERVPLRLSAEYDLLQGEGVSAMFAAMVAEGDDDGPPHHPKSSMTERAQSSDLSDAYVIDLTKHIDRVNHERRREREAVEAKRRSKLGIEGPM